jgi:hypothetical protein
MIGIESFGQMNVASVWGKTPAEDESSENLEKGSCLAMLLEPRKALDLKS